MATSTDSDIRDTGLVSGFHYTTLTGFRKPTRLLVSFCILAGRHCHSRRAPRLVRPPRPATRRIRRTPAIRICVSGKTLHVFGCVELSISPHVLNALGSLRQPSERLRERLEVLTARGVYPDDTWAGRRVRFLR